MAYVRDMKYTLLQLTDPLPAHADDDRFRKFIWNHDVQEET
jgi:hypothetical protein